MKASRFILFLILFWSVNLFAQKNPKIDLELTITLNGSPKKDTGYVVTIKNVSTKEEQKVHGKNKINAKLDYQCDYEVLINYNGYFPKKILINTEAPVAKWVIATDINLTNRGKDTGKVGKIAYDSKTNTFLPGRAE